MIFLYIIKKDNFKVFKPPRPQMAKVAHSAIIIQKAFRIYKKKKLEGTLRKGVVKVREAFKKKKKKNMKFFTL